MKLGILMAGLLLVSGPALAAGDRDLAAKADALIAPLVKGDRFSGAVLVARDGKPVFRKGFGLANREWNVPNDPTTKFRIGSITKQFTATAILQLQEAGKISVDDPVSKYYTDAPSAWSGITLKHLLTHTSGIPSYTGIPHFFDEDARRDRTPEEIVKLTADKPLDFPPGSKFAYDNSGYVLLGYIVEKVSGERYADYLQHHIFDPLGMKATGYDDSDVILPERAAGYGREKGRVVNAHFLSMTEPFSAGSLYSTVDDMLIWDQALANGKLLKPESMQAMFTNYGHGYGFGWFIGDFSGHPYVAHSGGINGFSTQFDRYTKDKLTVLVFANREDGAPVARIAVELGALYLGVPPRTAVAGGDVLLRRFIEGLHAGMPNYDEMSPEAAQATRTQLAGIQKIVAAWGAIKSITLAGADPGGVDRYQVTFEKGAAEWSIIVDKDGKLATAGFNPNP